jgi:hypothetical protein
MSEKNKVRLEGFYQECAKKSAGRGKANLRGNLAKIIDGVYREVTLVTKDARAIKKALAVAYPYPDRKGSKYSAWRAEVACCMERHKIGCIQLHLFGGASFTK